LQHENFTKATERQTDLSTTTETSPMPEAEPPLQPKEPTRDMLRALAAFVPELAALDKGGEWVCGEKLPDGSFTMSGFILCKTGVKLVERAYELGFVDPVVNWPEWQNTPEARRLFNDHAEVAQASALDLTRMLTTIIRGDRFCEGNIGGAIDSGCVLAIAERARVLAFAN
jgi:Family of unknown function (DUF6508)